MFEKVTIRMKLATDKFRIIAVLIVLHNRIDNLEQNTNMKLLIFIQVQKTLYTPGVQIEVKFNNYKKWLDFMTCSSMSAACMTIQGSHLQSLHRVLGTCKGQAATRWSRSTSARAAAATARPISAGPSSCSAPCPTLSRYSTLPELIKHD